MKLLTALLLAPLASLRRLPPKATESESTSPKLAVRSGAV
jgi:hypothetical protein